MNTTKSASKRAPVRSKTRTNRDWVMIALGAFLTLLFLTAGYWSIGGPDGNPVPRKRGPVKHPKPVGMLPHLRDSALSFHWTSDGGAEFAVETKLFGIPVLVHSRKASLTCSKMLKT